MSKNPYAAFDTDQNVEVEGVLVNYGDFRVRLARAGGSNTAYMSAFDRKTRALRRTGSTSPQQMEVIAIELLAETCVKSWEVKKVTESGTNWVSGIVHPQTLEVIPFSVTNVKEVFDLQPNLARALLNEANSQELYLKSALEEEAGN